MNRITYIVLLILPCVICGAVFKNFPKDPPSVLPILLGVYIPLLTIIRMKSLGMTWREILKAFWYTSFKERMRIFTDK